MLTTLVAVVAFTVGFVLAGAFYARRDDEADADRWQAYDTRLQRCEAEQAQRELLVADACSKITTASKRIQTRLAPPSNTTDESPLAMRARLKG